MSTAVAIDRSRDGRFVNGGKPGPGRPVGARSKLTTQFLADVEASWRKHGAVVLDRVAQEEPAQFLRAICMLMPKEAALALTVDHHVEITQILADFRGLNLPDPALKKLLRLASLPKMIDADAG